MSTPREGVMKVRHLLMDALAHPEFWEIVFVVPVIGFHLCAWAGWVLYEATGAWIDGKAEELSSR